MNKVEIETAARLLVEARRTGTRLDTVPEALIPRSPEDAYAVQLATVHLLGDGMAGWKVAFSPDGLLYGILLRSRVFPEGATIPSSDLSMVGVEAEVAFRCHTALPARDADYSYDEVAGAVTALPAIEILDTRFRDFDGTPAMAKAADFMSNSAFVAGVERPDWRSIDLSQLEARLTVDRQEIIRTTAGHAAGDPLRPAVALANVLRLSSGLRVGAVITTGTFTGMNTVPKTSHIVVNFPALGIVRCRFAEMATA